MTAAAEAGMMTDREAAAVTLAREKQPPRPARSARSPAPSPKWADDALAGGKPPKWIVQQVVAAGRLIAAAARGEAAVL